MDKFTSNGAIKDILIRFASQYFQFPSYFTYAKPGLRTLVICLRSEDSHRSQQNQIQAV